jgi:hypothetical protein
VGLIAVAMLLALVAVVAVLVYALHDLSRPQHFRPPVMAAITTVIRIRDQDDDDDLGESHGDG